MGYVDVQLIVGRNKMKEMLMRTDTIVRIGIFGWIRKVEGRIEGCLLSWKTVNGTKTKTHFAILMYFMIHNGSLRQ